MRKLLVVLALLALPAIALEGSSTYGQAPGMENYRENMWRQFYDPYLIRQAVMMGLYSHDTLPILREKNPFFMRGDFNGDGGMDVAFWVYNPEDSLKGVAILHSTLDTLYVFGAGHLNPTGRGNYIGGSLWHLLPVGHVESHPLSTIPEAGVVEGEPFTFKRETPEFVVLGKSAFVIYWAEGRYWMFWTAD